MAFTTQDRTNLIEVYIAAFNRAPDAAGLSFWSDSIKNGTNADVKAVANAIFNDQTITEVANNYPAYLTNAEYVEQVYLNVFNRPADAEGKAFWVGAMNSGENSRGETVLEMVKSLNNAGSEADKALFNNKVAVGEYFAVTVKSNDVDVAKSILANITADPATVDTAKAVADGSLGKSFTLTTGVDNIVGTAGNDTINAVIDGTTTTNQTLTGLDAINGGAGTDTLNIRNISAADKDKTDLSVATISNVETINIQAVGNISNADASNTAVTDNVDFSGITGLQTINATKSVSALIKAATTTDVNVSGASGVISVVGGKDVTVTDATTNKAITVGNGAAGGDAAGKITITDTNNTGAAVITTEGGTDVTVTTTADKANSGNIVVGHATNGQASGAVVVTQNSTSNSTAMTAGNVTVTGGSTVDITANMTNTAVKGGAAGDITAGTYTVVAGNTTTDVTVKQVATATDFANDASAGTAEVSTVTFGALKAGEKAIISAGALDGAGTDLTFTAAKDLTAAQVAAAFASLTAADKQAAGGVVANGIFTGTLDAGWTSGAADGANVTFTATAVGNQASEITVSARLADGTTNTANVADFKIASKTDGTAAGASTAVDVTANYGNVVINDNATKSIKTITIDGYDAATLGGATGLDALTTLTLKNGTGVNSVTTAATNLTLNLDKVTGATTINSAKITDLTINTSGTASTGAIAAAAATTVTINAEAALSGGGTFTAATLIDVNGSAAVNLTGATTDTATLATIDASGNTGGVTAVLGSTNSVKFTGGSGNDSLKLGNTAIATGKNIDMGAGDDTLTIAAGTTSATIVGTVTGGEGTDTLAMGYADAVAVSLNTNFHAKVGGFERLTINDPAGVDDDNATIYTVNLANLAYNYVTVNGTVTDTDPDESDTLALTGMAANGTVAFGGLSTAGSNYTVALADATGGADVLNYVLASTSAGTVTANLVETFNITSSSATGGTITANGDTVKTITVSGNDGVNLTSTATTLKTVDAGGLTGTGDAGGLVFTANNASMTVTGGAGNDKITIKATAGGSTFYGNGGNDTFSIDGSADLITIYGGDGADTFDFNGVSTNKSNYVVINGVNTGDKFDLVGVYATMTGFNAAKITLAQGATESTQAYLDQAMTTLTLGQVGWFQYNGNTYIAADAGTESANSFVDGADFVTMITGLVDLSTASFNATYATLEIA